MISCSLSLTCSMLQQVAIEVLDPFEVADSHAAGVAQDVGDEEPAVGVENLVPPRGSWAIRAFGDQASPDPTGGVRGGDLVLHRGWNQDVGIQLEQLGVADVA